MDQDGQRHQCDQQQGGSARGGSARARDGGPDRGQEERLRDDARQVAVHERDMERVRQHGGQERAQGREGSPQRAAPEDHPGTCCRQPADDQQLHRHAVVGPAEPEPGQQQEVGRDRPVSERLRAGVPAGEGRGHALACAERVEQGERLVEVAGAVVGERVVRPGEEADQRGEHGGGEDRDQSPDEPLRSACHRDRPVVRAHRLFHRPCHRTALTASVPSPVVWVAYLALSRGKNDRRRGVIRQGSLGHRYYGERA